MYKRLTVPLGFVRSPRDPPGWRSKRVCIISTVWGTQCQVALWEVFCQFTLPPESAGPVPGPLPGSHISTALFPPRHTGSEAEPASASPRLPELCHACQDYIRAMPTVPGRSAAPQVWEAGGRNARGAERWVTWHVPTPSAPLPPTFQVSPPHTWDRKKLPLHRMF